MFFFSFSKEKEGKISYSSIFSGRVDVMDFGGNFVESVQGKTQGLNFSPRFDSVVQLQKQKKS